jgi:hypothetical protein
MGGNSSRSKSNAEPQDPIIKLNRDLYYALQSQGSLVKCDPEQISGLLLQGADPNFVHINNKGHRTSMLSLAVKRGPRIANILLSDERFDPYLTHNVQVLTSGLVGGNAASATSLLSKRFPDDLRYFADCSCSMPDRTPVVLRWEEAHTHSFSSRVEAKWTSRGLTALYCALHWERNPPPGPQGSEARAAREANESLREKPLKLVARFYASDLSRSISYQMVGVKIVPGSMTTSEYTAKIQLQCDELWHIPRQSVLLERVAGTDPNLTCVEVELSLPRLPWFQAAVSHPPCDEPRRPGIARQLASLRLGPGEDGLTVLPPEDDVARLHHASRNAIESDSSGWLSTI